MNLHPFDPIILRLNTLRVRLNRRDAGEAAWGAVITLCGGGLFSLSLSLLLGARYGYLAAFVLALILLLAAYKVWRIGLVPRRRRAKDSALALWVEKERPELRSGLITAVQAKEALETKTPWPGFQPELVQRSAKETWVQFGEIDLNTLVDTTRLKQSSRWGAFVLLCTCALLLYKPDLTRLALAHLSGLGGFASGEQGPAIEVDSLVTDLSLTFQYPDYLKRQTRHISRSGGDFSAIQGTRAQLKGRVDQDLEALLMELESDPGSRWPVARPSATSMEVEMQVEASDRYRFIALTRRGDFVREAGWRVVDARQDQAPLVRLLLPERDLEVNPSDAIPMVFEASDDHGLGLIELVIERREGGEVTRKTLREGGGEQTANGATNLNVAELRLLPGEAVDVWFEAHDQKREPGPNRGESKSRRITIYSPEAEHAERLTELGQVIDAMILLLAERLESPVSQEGELDLKALVPIQLNIARATAQVVRALETLVGAMSTDSLASSSMVNTIRKLLDDLGAHHDMEEAQLRLLDTSRGAHRRPKQMIKLLDSHNSEGVVVLEEGAWALKNVVEEARQRQILAQGRDLLDAQQALMKEIQAMKAKGESGLSLEAKRSLDELESTLRRMEEELSRLIEASPYENQNLSKEASNDEQEVRSLRDRLDEVRKLMAEGKHDEAMKLMEDLQRETQELLATLQGDFDLQAPQEESSLALNEFDLKLGELTSEQAGLTNETEEEERRLDAETKQAREEALRQAMKKALELAKKLESLAEDVNTTPLHRSDKEAFDALKERSSSAKEAIEALAYDEAEREAARIKQGSEALRDEVGESEARTLDRDVREGLKAAMDGLQEMQTLAQELEDELKEVEPSPQKASSERRRGAAKLGKRQEKLEDVVSELEKQIESVDQELPGLKKALSPSMEGAKESMRAAGEELKSVRPGEASGHQRRALDQLGAMKKAIDKRIQDASGRSGGGVGIHRREQRVDIPGEERASPKALRDALLKAMKERAPEHYEDAIERYYEELVR